MTGEALQIILLAEDNAAERELIHLTIAELNRAAKVIDVTNGVDCLAYLRREGPYANAARPDLIVLDNRMPGLTGAQVLEVLDRDADLRNISVLYWSSASERDVSSAFRSRACARKPWSLDEYRWAFESVCQLLPALR